MSRNSTTSGPAGLLMAAAAPASDSPVFNSSSFASAERFGGARREVMVKGSAQDRTWGNSSGALIGDSLPTQPVMASMENIDAPRQFTLIQCVVAAVFAITSIPLTAAWFYLLLHTARWLITR